MIFAHRTDIGKRSSNQDFFYVPAEDEPQLVIVADGMGGHRAGDLASRKAVQSMVDYIKAAGEGAPPERLLSQAVSNANRQIHNISAQDESCAGMGTTVVAALVEAERFTFANVGDSRLYLIGAEGIARISRDHSLVEELVQSGIITRQQAKTHPQRNILTRAVGASRFVETDTGSAAWRRGDIIMLCSDGLHGSLTDEEMARIIAESRDLLEACDALTDAALANGSTDNITVILVQNTEGGL